MSECPHDIAERETACVDGYCPLCLASECSLLKARVERLRAALERVSAVSLDRKLGQIVFSDHYEKAWLDCAEISKEALKADEENT